MDNLTFMQKNREGFSYPSPDFTFSSMQ